MSIEYIRKPKRKSDNEYPIVSILKKAYTEKTKKACEKRINKAIEDTAFKITTGSEQESINQTKAYIKLYKDLVNIVNNDSENVRIMKAVEKKNQKKEDEALKRKTLKRWY